MRVAYLVSRYPAVSHTFVLREVQALRRRGLEVGTFSVRRAMPADVLGPEAQQEAASTRWLVPPAISDCLRAAAWACGRPRRVLEGVGWALRQPGGVRGKAMGLAYLAEAALLAQRLCRDGYQHLHCHFGNAGSTTAMLAADLARVPFSLTVHGSELSEPHRHHLAEKVARATFVACVSWYGRAQLMTLTPDEQWAKLHVVRCGLADLPARPELVERAAGGEAAKAWEVLCVGRLSSEKGHRVLLEAVAALRDRGVPLHCTIIGDGPLRAELEANAAERGALDGLVTFTGALPVRDVLERYSAADVVVLASFSEGVPVVLIEALAMARPVVATAVGGVPELVRDRESGLLVSPGNAAALADAIQWVLEHPVEAAGLGLAGAALVQREFDLAASAAALDALFTGERTSAGSPTPGAGPEGQASNGAGEPSGPAAPSRWRRPFWSRAARPQPAPPAPAKPEPTSATSA